MIVLAPPVFNQDFRLQKCREYFSSQTESEKREEVNFTAEHVKEGFWALMSLPMKPFQKQTRGATMIIGLPVS
jgi:hypothetical protein